MRTSRLEADSTGGTHWVIQCNPTPASRPRIPRFGRPYYVGKYKEFRLEFAAMLEETPDLPGCSSKPMEVHLLFVIGRPKSPANSFPMGDVDNYAKAVLDSIQGKAILKDDKQVTRLNVVKRYTLPEEEPHIHIYSKEAS